MNTESLTISTSLGAWTADTAGLGYDGGAMVFTAQLAVIAAAGSPNQDLPNRDLLECDQDDSSILVFPNRAAAHAN